MHPKGMIGNDGDVEYEKVREEEDKRKEKEGRVGGKKKQNKRRRMKQRMWDIKAEKKAKRTEDGAKEEEGA